MSRHADGFLDSRGTVLVASGSTLFTNIVGGMLAECGFEVAYPAESEAAWLSVTRTQPALVICDSGVPAANIKRLIAEVCARRLPLLMAWPQAEHDEHARDVVLPNRVAWLTFPIDNDAFRTTIDGLLPVMGPVQRLTLTVAGAKVEAATAPRSFEEVRRDAVRVADDGTLSTADRVVRRSIRLLP